MKKIKLTNIILVIIIILSVLFVARNVFAADAQDMTYLLNSTSGNSSTGGTTTGGTTTGTDSNSISAGNSTTSGGSSTIIQNNVLNTNNIVSSYNNTTLPKTGVEDSMPAIVLVVVLGISAVYAYKKVQDYRNI
mgnify:CR=1 FL=1